MKLNEAQLIDKYTVFKCLKISLREECKSFKIYLFTVYIYLMDQYEYIVDLISLT